MFSKKLCIELLKLEYELYAINKAPILISPNIAECTAIKIALIEHIATKIPNVPSIINFLYLILDYFLPL